MAFTRVQGATNFAGGSQTTATTTFGAGVTPGNTVIGAVHFGDNNTTITSITDNKGNSYSFTATSGASPGTYTDNVKEGSGSFAVTATFILGNIPAGGPTVITAALSPNGGNVCMIADEFSGCFASSTPSDGTTASHTGQVLVPGTGANALTSGNITTTGNGDLIWSCTCENEDAILSTAGTGFTGPFNDTGAGTNRLQSEWRTQAAAGTIAGTWTNGTGASAAALVMAIKPAATGAAPIVSARLVMM
jgi:hypothetical protein